MTTSQSIGVRLRFLEAFMKGVLSSELERSRSLAESKLSLVTRLFPDSLTNIDSKCNDSFDLISDGSNDWSLSNDSEC